jgi:hypothetical protein
MRAGTGSAGEAGRVDPAAGAARLDRGGGGEKVGEAGGRLDRAAQVDLELGDQAARAVERHARAGAGAKRLVEGGAHLLRRDARADPGFADSLQLKYSSELAP